MTPALTLATRVSAFMLLPLALPACVAAQDDAQRAYDALFLAYYEGQAPETLPEFQADLLLVDHIDKILKEAPDLKGWNTTDTTDAITAFGTPTRAPYKQRVTARLRAAMAIDEVKAASELAADPAASKTIKCVARRTSRAASEWAACAGRGGRPFTAAEQALGTKALETINDVVNHPDLNSAVVGIICHTLDRFSDRISSEEMTRKYSMTISLIESEKPIACDRAKPRYAALIGHDPYLSLQPSLVFESDKKGE